jgi:hypothetical protein
MCTYTFAQSCHLVWVFYGVVLSFRFALFISPSTSTPFSPLFSSCTYGVHGPFDTCSPLFDAAALPVQLASNNFGKIKSENRGPFTSSGQRRAATNIYGLFFFSFFFSRLPRNSLVRLSLWLPSTSCQLPTSSAAECCSPCSYLWVGS